MMLRAALELAARGWPVIPLNVRGKAPLSKLVRRGVEHATCDHEVIGGWWSQMPGANIGITCQRALVVDVDFRSDGDSNLETLLREHGPLPKTLAQRSGGGVHYLFNLPGLPLRGKLIKGVDLVHGPRRYIVAAPSIHSNGRGYTWLTPLRTPLADAPEWLVNLARHVDVGQLQGSARHASASSTLVLRARCYVRMIPPAVAGQGGHAHTFLTASRLVRGFSLNPDEAYMVMSEWNRTCVPPWSESDLRRKIDQALHQGRMPFGTLLEERTR